MTSTSNKRFSLSFFVLTNISSASLDRNAALSLAILSWCLSSFAIYPRVEFSSSNLVLCLRDASSLVLSSFKKEVFWSDDSYLEWYAELISYSLLISSFLTVLVFGSIRREKSLMGLFDILIVIIFIILHNTICKFYY